MPRKYRKTRRAELEEDTRRRITEALVELHGTIGPLKTTIRAVADQAGVERATVYRHFPDLPSMFAACSAHWLKANPFPDPATWTSRSLRRRALQALGELYDFYSDNRQMLANVYRDATLVEALKPSLEGFANYLEVARDVIVGTGQAPDRDLTLVRAAVGHALVFPTWASLVPDQGLSNSQAVLLMTGMIRKAASTRE